MTVALAWSPGSFGAMDVSQLEAYEYLQVGPNVLGPITWMDSATPASSGLQPSTQSSNGGGGSIAPSEGRSVGGERYGTFQTARGPCVSVWTDVPPGFTIDPGCVRRDPIICLPTGGCL